MLEIKRAKLENYQEIDRILVEIHNYHYEKFPSHFKKISLFFSFDKFQAILNEENIEMIIGEENNKITGICLVRIIQIEETGLVHSRKSILIENLGVIEEYRKRGIASKLLDEVDKIAKQKNINHIQLQVWGFNERAIKLYKKNKYKNRTLVLQKNLGVF
ncbi:MAG: GNAT family N-acetyltransferase [Cetobacterium sp.]|uniref:GNAT family N-acetyltransferase n=1 Tax=Cetobacterium sp. TaxID=2071632 RepID=UPI003EE7E8FB